MEDQLETLVEEPEKQSSPRGIAASQANGRKSQGPKPPEGRLKCSNAVKSQFKHNMLAETVLLQTPPPPQPRGPSLLVDLSDSGVCSPWYFRPVGNSAYP